MYLYSTNKMQEIKWNTGSNTVEFEPNAVGEMTLYINERDIANTSEELETLIIILKDAKEILEQQEALEEAKNRDDN